MEALRDDGFLKFNSDTLEKLRKQYGFDTPARMTEALQILEEWMKKQEHFVKKDFPREYLERILIHNKGSVEKAKKKLDKICTLRTLVPDYFEVKDINELDKTVRDSLMDVLLPTMTPDHSRVCMFKGKDVESNSLIARQYLSLHLATCEYLQYFDYNNGLIYLADWRGGHPVSFSKAMNIADFKIFTDIVLEGFSMRVKGVHFLTDSPVINILVTFVKQFVSDKIASRFHVHTSMDTVYEHIPRHVLPAEYGGKDKAAEDIRDDHIKALSSPEFISLRHEMKGGRTDEARRPKDAFYEQHMGMAGTFRNLSVD
ncbi:alpha-tocopherol transfer protein-like [Aricia agestis]|uniref:alpha-tocopherol transfer protein-like n=1 Tax=Aricia agestis TaxID=91739 RepID=UPI001C20B7CC|nr:alpha-tocopherol transfer protein-like [Aricia agestis]